MNYNENYLYFNELATAVGATGDGALYKSSSFIGANVTGAAEVTLHFEARNGTAADDTVAVTMSSSDVLLLMKQLTSVLSNPRGGMFTQSDNVASDGPTYFGGSPAGDSLESFMTGVSGIVITTVA